MQLRGMTFIDVIVGTGIMLVVFLSIFGAYKIAIELVYNTKARVGGMSLVAEKLEYLRGQPYDMLGTVGGIPSGTIPQTATTTVNNIPYTVRTLILYIDDPADGTGNADTNGITADYKELKVAASWVVRGKTYTTLAVTRVAPHGIESLASGGTLRVNVFDALAAPVVGATVHITNASTSPTIDVTVSTDSTGSVAFPGAPQASNYKVSITKSGYSSAQTYDISTQNPNPNPAHISVANQKTTTISFAIDRLAGLTLATYSPIDTGTFQESFTGDNETVSTPVAPLDLASWDLLAWSSSQPVEGDLVVQLAYQSGGVWVPIPDGVLTGNSTGLSTSVSLSALSTSTYPSVALRTLFTPTDASSTPPTVDWSVDYHAGPSLVPNVGLTFYGTKTIGTSISGAPIYKVVVSTSTNAVGTYATSSLEWDTYTLSLTGTSYDIGELCPSPASVMPGSSVVERITLVPKSTHSLRVEVMDAGVPITDAQVALTNPGNESHLSSSCGQSFFSNLSATTYTLTVTKSGYQVSTQTISVSGATVITVPLVH